MSRRRMHLGRDQRRALWEKMNRHCAYCGLKIGFSEVTVDHMIPLSRGGADRMDNMVCCCTGCNQLKRDMTLEEFRMLMAGNNRRLLEQDPMVRAGVRFGTIKLSGRRVKFYFEKRRGHDNQGCGRADGFRNTNKNHKR